MIKKTVLALLMAISGAANAQYTLFVEGYSDNYTESVPVLDFFGSWKGAKEYNKGDSAYANNFIASGVKYNSFSFATFYRYDYYMTMDPNAAQYRYLFHNKRDQLLDKDYIYHFHEQRLTTMGFTLGNEFELSDQLTMTAYVNVLYSAKYQDRLVTDGYINGKTRLGDADVDYHFSKDGMLQFLVVDDKPQGYGVSVDIDVNYQYNELLHINLNIKDLFHFVTFNKSPYAQGTMRVDHFTYDDNDVRLQQPLADLKTHEGGNEHRFTMHLPTRISFLATQQLFEHYSVSLQYKNNEVYDSVTMKGGYAPTPDSKIAISYNLNNQTVGLHGRYHQFHLDVLTDTATVNLANSLSVFIGMSWDL